MPSELRTISREMPIAERRRLQQLGTKWRKVHCWHPNQLRHTKATEVRRRFGLDGAQVIMGHAKADVTQVYAERSSALAVEIAKKIG
jgi:integrase